MERSRARTNDICLAFASKGFKRNNENGEFLMLLKTEINTSP